MQNPASACCGVRKRVCVRELKVAGCYYFTGLQVEPDVIRKDWFIGYKKEKR